MNRQAKVLNAVLAGIGLDANFAILETFEHAFESLAAIDRLIELDLGFVTGPVLEIARANERPVDAGRRNLEAIVPGDRIGDIEHRRMPFEITSQSSTVIEPSGRSAMS